MTLLLQKGLQRPAQQNPRTIEAVFSVVEQKAPAGTLTQQNSTPYTSNNSER